MREVHKYHYIHKNGFKVEPTISKYKPYKQAVMITDTYNLVYKNKVTTGEFKHITKTINKALENAVEFIYNKIK